MASASLPPGLEAKKAFPISLAIRADNSGSSAFSTIFCAVLRRERASGSSPRKRATRLSSSWHSACSRREASDESSTILMVVSASVRRPRRSLSAQIANPSRTPSRGCRAIAYANAVRKFSYSSSNQSSAIRRREVRSISINSFARTAKCLAWQSRAAASSALRRSRSRANDRTGVGSTKRASPSRRGWTTRCRLEREASGNRAIVPPNPRSCKRPLWPQPSLHQERRKGAREALGARHRGARESKRRPWGGWRPASRTHTRPRGSEGPFGAEHAQVSCCEFDGREEVRRARRHTLRNRRRILVDSRRPSGRKALATNDEERDGRLPG